MEFVERIANMNVAQMLVKYLSLSEVEEQILHYNTDVQLFSLGENSLGVKLSDIGGNYSPVTLALHPEKKPSVITLFDTGAFYGSFRVVPLPNGDFEITANPMKDDTNLFREWGGEVVGLQDENLQKVLILLEDLILNELLG